MSNETNIWHTMDEEPLMAGVILYSHSSNGIYDASYIGDGKFEINGLIIDKCRFDRWVQRGDFFKLTGLSDSIRNKEK